MIPTTELPLLDETRCTGCGDCVLLCPTNCLEASLMVPWLPRPGDCVSCSVCMLVCPADAIRMTVFDPASEDEGTGDPD